MERIDLRTVDECVGRSLELLRQTYRTGPANVGGWYHNLDSGVPGPSATSVGMSSFLINGIPFDHRDECLRFLQGRQIRSKIAHLDGGWAVNTSFGQPVTEATALVSRLLVVTRVLLTPGAPDAGRARQWLTHNQNGDGGWGSFAGQESRVWLTAMAVRALSELDPHCQSLDRGTHWLLNSRDPVSHAWGERPGQPPTVTHTAYALSALVDSGAARTERAVSDAVEAGYGWLGAHLDPTSIYDDHARSETYNVTRSGSDGKATTWHNTVWHPGLPFAVSALVRQPGAGRFDLLCEAVRTIIAAQQPDGRWPSSESAAAVSVWTLWPFLEALNDVTRATPVRDQDVMTWVAPGTLVLQRGPDRNVSFAREVWRMFRRRWWRWLGRRWAALVLATFLLAGAALVMLAEISWGQFATGLAVPVLLLILQEAMSRGRARR